MSDKTIKRDNMCRIIYSTLQEYPDLLNDAINACCDGIRASIERMNERTASLDLAFISCLGMLEKSRKNKKLNDFQNLLVLKHLKRYGGNSPVEREVIAQISSQIEENISE